jgi:hypothetical protein
MFQASFKRNNHLLIVRPVLKMICVIAPDCPFIGSNLCDIPAHGSDMILGATAKDLDFYYQYKLAPRWWWWL